MLVKYAQILSAYANCHAELLVLKSLWDTSLSILTQSLSLAEVDRELARLDIPDTWKNYLCVQGCTKRISLATQDIANSVGDFLRQHEINQGTSERRLYVKHHVALSSPLHAEDCISFNSGILEKDMYEQEEKFKRYKRNTV
jgi:hypothetical protein